MNNLLRTLALACIFTVAGRAATAQVSADARVSATIVTPMTISQENGQLELSRGAAMTVNTGSALVGTMQTSGDGGEVSAEFNITGSPAYAYSVSVPQYVSVVKGDKIFTLATEARIANGAAKLSKIGTASVSIEGIVVATARAQDAAPVAPSEMLLALNDDGDESYVPNGLPVIINNN